MTHPQSLTRALPLLLVQLVVLQLVLLLVLQLLCPAVQAQVQDQQAQDQQQAPDLDQVLLRIEAERAQHTEAFLKLERLCYQKFAVNDCLRGVRAQKRKIFDDLRRQEVLVNDELRKRRGIEELDRLEQRSPR